MNLQQRMDLLIKLGQYILSDDMHPIAIGWQEAKEKAARENNWFIPEFIELATNNIAKQFLQKDILEKWVGAYKLPANAQPKTVGIVMAGNIPLVGFHDLLCVFISGHKAMIKLSSKDQALLKHIVQKMSEWDKEVNDLIVFSDMLKNCDAYIATGSNNSAGYFEYYFKKYPHIIRRNRTSVAILTGEESKEELESLADDVYLYFGLGCRNVSKIYVPENYDFVPLLRAFDKYNHLGDHHKYKNNYDYNLAIHLLNKKLYMSNKSLLLIEEASPFSPISQLNYEVYKTPGDVLASLKDNPAIQCVAGKNFVAFGQTQYPSVDSYADGVDTLQFLATL